MHLAMKAHWTDLKEMLKAFPDKSFGIEFHEDEADIDDELRSEGQIGTITALLTKRQNLRIAFHAPVLNTDPTSFDPAHRKESVARVMRTIELASEVSDKIGSRTPVVNAHFLSLTSAPAPVSVGLKARAMRIAKESARKLKNYARKKNVEFTLENNPPVLFKEEGKHVFGLFGRCAEDIMQCGCNSCLDISHAYMSCFYFQNRKRKVTLPDIGRIDNVLLPDVEVDMKYYGKMPSSVVSLEKFINVSGNTIRHVHLNDSIGYFHEGLVLGEGDIDFKHILPLMNRGIMFVLEIKRAHLYQQRISESMDYLKKQGLLNI